MTKPPSGGSASASSTSEYGATTISGTPQSGDADSPAQNPAPEDAERQDKGRRSGRRFRKRDRDAQTEQFDVSGATDPRAGADRREDADRSAGVEAARAEASPIQGVRPGARNRGPRRARLQIRHIDPVTVLKFSCVLAIALFFVWLIVIGVLYGVLDASGVIDHVNNAVTTINGAGSKAPITAGIVFGGAAIVGVVNIVLFIALTTIGAVIYNLCADLVGGIEITLSER